MNIRNGYYIEQLIRMNLRNKNTNSTPYIQPNSNFPIFDIVFCLIHCEKSEHKRQKVSMKTYVSVSSQLKLFRFKFFVQIILL